MHFLFRIFGISHVELERAAGRVAELARNRLVTSGLVLQVAPARPAVQRGYARVHAASAVRRSLGQEAAGMTRSQIDELERLAVSRLTERLMNRATLHRDTPRRLAA
jgi:hypothetical protein